MTDKTAIKSQLEYLTDDDLKNNYIPLLVAEKNLKASKLNKEEQKDNEQLEFYSEYDLNNSRKTNKVFEMAKRNPFVPIGCLITCGVLMRGLYAMKQGDRAKSQRMMRFRVASQGITILALIAGTMIAPYFVKRPE